MDSSTSTPGETVASPNVPRPTLSLHLPLRTLITSNTMLSPTNSEYGLVSSPMSSLALNLSGLSTESFGDTPKRKLSLSSTESTPDFSSRITPDRSNSTGSSESGCFVDSPGSMVDSPSIEFSMKNHRLSSFSSRSDEETGSYGRRRSFPFRSFNSLPMPTFRLSPDFTEENSVSSAMEMSFNSENSFDAAETSLNLEDSSFSATETSVSVEKAHDHGTSLLKDEGSQDSGVSMDRDHGEDFRFAAPVGMPPRRLKVINEDTCSPQKYSPVKPGTSLFISNVDFIIGEQEECLSPVALKSSPLTSIDDNSDDDDDGFLEVLDKEVAEINNLPGSFNNLFCAPVLGKKSPPSAESFKIKSCRKLLSRSQSLDIRTPQTRVGSKRQSPGRDDNSTPVQKRRRGLCLSETFCSLEFPPKPKVLLKRCYSETEAMIKSALDRVADDPDLIGDGSKAFSLPTIPGKHQDLKSITPETMVDVLNHEYDHVVEQFLLIDCRYPYEYDGGHIQGAKNYYTKESIIENLINGPIQSKDSTKRSILIFHCEFSSERGPSLSRFLRNMDRASNKECYPELFYPEIYLLHGGYKDFFESQKEYCTPVNYMPMLHEGYKKELRMFKIKSKSWAGEKKSRSALFGSKF